MPYTNANTNMTTSAGLTPGMQTYYNRELLRTFEPELVHLQFGDEHRMPENNGLVMNMRKFIPLDAKTTELEEGNPGESTMLAETEVTVQLKQYGDHALFTDKLDMSHLDLNIQRKTKQTLEIYVKAGELASGNFQTILDAFVNGQGELEGKDNH